jgi:hypothetical protein
VLRVIIQKRSIIRAGTRHAGTIQKAMVAPSHEKAGLNMNIAVIPIAAAVTQVIRVIRITMIKHKLRPLVEA